MVDTGISVHRNQTVRVRIALGRLKSIISGGIQQIASRHDDVLLSGLESYDPDDPDTNSNLTSVLVYIFRFTWNERENRECVREVKLECDIYKLCVFMTMSSFHCYCHKCCSVVLINTATVVTVVNSVTLRASITFFIVTVISQGAQVFSCFRIYRKGTLCIRIRYNDHQTVFKGI